MSLRVWLKDFTSDLNQPAFKAVIFSILTLLSGLVYLFCIVVTIVIQETVFGLWLTFLAAGWGITSFDYKTKRSSVLDEAQRAVVNAKKDGEPPPPFEQGDKATPLPPSVQPPL
jgi:hypothetical protein